MMPIRQTHTYVVLEISRAFYDEVERKLRDAGYDHAFDEDAEHGAVIDMHGIALARERPFPCDVE